MNENLDIARQWLAKARNDLLNADNNLKAEAISLDTVCFHCQQAAEKLLKAFLAAHGEPPPITHDLILLLEKILEISPRAETLRNDLVLLTPYAVEIRYPDDGFIPLKEDAQEARASAENILRWLSSVLPRLFTGA